MTKGSDIEAFLHRIDIFGGVLASDEIGKVRRGKCYVVNTKPRTHAGEHWVVVDWTRKKKYFFDSFGNSPTFYGFPKTDYCGRHLQHADAETCGLYAIYYVVQRGNRRSTSTLLQPFARDKKYNDEFVRLWLLEWSKSRASTREETK